MMRVARHLPLGGYHLIHDSVHDSSFTDARALQVSAIKVLVAKLFSETLFKPCQRVTRTPSLRLTAECQRAAMTAQQAAERRPSKLVRPVQLQQRHAAGALRVLSTLLGAILTMPPT